MEVEIRDSIGSCDPRYAALLQKLNLPQPQTLPWFEGNSWEAEGGTISR
jgi:hypothetical protein